MRLSRYQNYAISGRLQRRLFRKYARVTTGIGTGGFGIRIDFPGMKNSARFGIKNFQLNSEAVMAFFFGRPC